MDILIIGGAIFFASNVVILFAGGATIKTVIVLFGLQAGAGLMYDSKPVDPPEPEPIEQVVEIEEHN